MDLVGRGTPGRTSNGSFERWLALQRVLGALVGLVGFAMLPPLAIALWSGDGLAPDFAKSLAVCWVLGFAMWFPVRRTRHELRTRDGFLVVTLAWIGAIAVCALPFVLGPTGLDYTDAFFEAASGLTTTGATSIAGLDALPRSLIFYRQSLHFLGGMGIVILAVAILPMLKIGGAQLFRAETTGPVKDTRLTPRIAQTAKTLWLVYLALNGLCALAYWMAGMSPFDALTHAFATMATGGFGNYDANFAHFGSPLLEWIAIVFMFIGGINFALHFYAYHRATTQHYFADAEVRAYVSIVIAAGLLVAATLWLAGRFGVGDSLRVALFHVVSNITTTGFTTTGFADWPGFLPLLMILIGFVGGCSSSTSGGMKVVRVLILFRQSMREVLQLIHPRGRFLVKLGTISVPGQVLAAVTGFCMLYVLCFVVMTLMVAATGVDLITAFSAVATCINNMGPGLGEVTVTFAGINDVAVWICSLAMILGRLEIFTVLVLLTPAFWRE
jgi:trk system potassium uptake protein TrkH